ncbi:MAG: Type 1 glutamine amidotransferase-like domain-containing protein [Gammaproteobacteria bacterium]
MQKNVALTVAFTLLFTGFSSAIFAAQFKYEPLPNGPVTVGPPNGTVIAVGGGVQGPRIYKAFIDAAGGPNALILDVPNNSIEKPMTVAPSWAGKGLRDHGAKNVRVLFTQSRKVANSDAFTAIINKAGGIWFDGGRQYHDIRAYAGTKTEQAFWGVLERGGVVGGSSAGMAVLGGFLVRGAPSHNNYIEDYPGSDKGFGFLRDTAADMHVVARERLPDLTSVIARYPKVLGISADEGTAWVIKGDIGHIIGRDKAFVYNGRETDPGLPYLTLYPGDVYNLYTRQVVSRAADRSPVTAQFITSLFEKYDNRRLGGAAVLVAEDGDVFVDRAFGIPPQTRYMPRTTLPQFPLGGMTKVFTSLCAQLPLFRPPVEQNVYFSSPLEKCVTHLSGPIGMHRTIAPPGDTEILSDVDELYRLDLGLQWQSTWPNADYSIGWTPETFDGVQALAAYATPRGKQAAFVRIPSRHAVVIILTNDPGADARGLSERILGKLLRTSP